MPKPVRPPPVMPPSSVWVKPYCSAHWPRMPARIENPTPEARMAMKPAQSRRLAFGSACLATGGISSRDIVGTPGLAVGGDGWVGNERRPASRGPRRMSSPYIAEQDGPQWASRGAGPFPGPVPCHDFRGGHHATQEVGQAWIRPARGPRPALPRGGAIRYDALPPAAGGEAGRGHRPQRGSPPVSHRDRCPTIRPFRGVRYDMAQVGALSDVVAPPYDVIDPELQDRLYDGQPVQRHPPGAEPRGAGRRRRPGPLHPRRPASSRTGGATGVLREDPHPALYVYHQTFEVEGQTHTRKGFLARVRLEPFGEGRIYPHEQTLSGPKADRLALFHATGFNLSPIFGLYPDAEAEVLAAVEAGPRGPHARSRRPTTSASSTGSGR